ncbi:hypothetical protein H9X96_03200 [Pedobacter sp. N36a]|uniref:hypothetical protein n=1 Tax=Pedobacter sp. N36a TaxID=2767996 RepID=UPI0016575E04|nr:hypothetical protein [Pedobacter sp. N36a]MBC8984777.1 hypothetical protein [Pedobacter sp. N36a]
MGKQEIEQQRTLVFEDLSRLSNPQNSLEKVANLANKVASKYEELSMGAFTIEVYEDLVSNGVSNVQVKYSDDVKSEIKRLKINNPSLKNALMSDIDKALKPLSDAVSELKKYSSDRIGYYTLISGSNKITFFNNRFNITQENIEVLKDEYCRIYIETEAEAKGYASLLDFVRAYNQMITDVNGYNSDLANKLRSTETLNRFITHLDGKTAIYGPNLAQFTYTTNN